MEKPTLTECCMRGLPLEVALEVRKHWDRLTDAQKAKLGFDRPLVDLDELLAEKPAGSVH